MWGAAQHNTAAVGVGLVGILIGGGVATFGPIPARRDEDDYTRSAFATYGDSLRAKLYVCVDQLRVVDRAGAEPPPTQEATGDTHGRTPE